MERSMDRRMWVAGMGAAAAGVALGGAAPLAAGETGSEDRGGVESGAARPARVPFEPMRHPQDAWMDAVPGVHRVILDATSPVGAAEGITYSNNLFNASASGYQLADSDLALILVLRHNATSYAFSHRMWEKYGAALQEGTRTPLPEGAPVPVANPLNGSGRTTLDALAARGAHFAVCGLSVRRIAGLIAGPGGDVDAAISELAANTIPNAHIMAAGVVAMQRAQEFGYSAIHVG